MRKLRYCRDMPKFVSIVVSAGLIQSCSVYEDRIQDSDLPLNTIGLLSIPDTIDLLSIPDTIGLLSIPNTIGLSSIPDAAPKAEVKSKFGNPSSYVVNGKRYYVKGSSDGFVQRGLASWYGKKFHGRRTSSGEIYDMYEMTAAHKTLPLPTYLEVINLKNKKRIIVKANDRGPFHNNRILDLSYVAAAKLDMVETGTGLVEVRAINPEFYDDNTAPISDISIDKDDSDFYVQIGAFSEIVNAERLKRNLDKLKSTLVRHW